MTKEEEKLLHVVLIAGGTEKVLFMVPHDVDAAEYPDDRNPYGLIEEDTIRAGSRYLTDDPGNCTGLSEKNLASVLKANQLNTRSETTVDNVKFVGHPVKLEDGTHFHLVFVVPVSAPRYLVDGYHELSRRFAEAIRHEERRCAYLSTQVKMMQEVHDETHSRPEADRHGSQQHSAYAQIQQDCKLAQELKKLHTDISRSGSVTLYLNGWLSISYCFPTLMKNTKVNPEILHLSLDRMQPYHSLILHKDPTRFLQSLPLDSSPFIRPMVDVLQPWKNFATIAEDACLPLEQVLTFAAHLIYWGKAVLIYSICETNDKNLAESFADAFKVSQRESSDSLHEILHNFNIPTTLATFNRAVSKQDELTRRVSMVEWLLKHRLIMQVHTYISICADTRTWIGGTVGQKVLNVYFSCGEISQETNDDLKRELSTPEYNVLMTTVKRKNISPEAVSLFAKLCRYFRGEHHVEHIMFCEDLLRKQVQEILERFQFMLVPCLHEDPACQMSEQNE